MRFSSTAAVLGLAAAVTAAPATGTVNAGYTATASPVVVAEVAAVGIPGEDLGTQADAGAVEVRFEDGRRQIVYLSDSTVGYRQGDRFGTTVALVDVDDDHIIDLLVGAPGRDVDGVADAGAVFLYRGSTTGFHLWKVLAQGTSGVPGQPQAGAAFGSSLSASAGSSSNPPSVTIGAPRWDVGAAIDAGAITDLTFSRSADPVFSGTLLTENSPEFGNTAESGDRFGATVSGPGGPGGIGAPGKTVSGAEGAGAAYVKVDNAGPTPYALVTQDTPGMTGSAEAGDGFGSALAGAAGRGILIGVPGEDVGTAKDAGMVNSFGDLDEDGVCCEPGPGFTQNSAGIDGTAEAGDHFGAALAAYAPEEQSDLDAALIGVPGEDIGTVRDAGMVDQIGGPERSLTETRTAGKAEPGDRFGSFVAAGNGAAVERRLMIGAPGEDAGAGAVVVIAGITAAEIWKQVTGRPEAGDGFGSAGAGLFFAP